MSIYHTTPGGWVIPVFDKADRMRKAREATGLDQTEFAQRLGMSRGTVSNYESGKTKRVSRPILAAWAMATGVPVQWLETGVAPKSGNDPEPREAWALWGSNPQPTD